MLAKVNNQSLDVFKIITLSGS